jgi:hypothetical protein
MPPICEAHPIVGDDAGTRVRHPETFPIYATYPTETHISHRFFRRMTGDRPPYLRRFNALKELYNIITEMLQKLLIFSMIMIK